MGKLQVGFVGLHRGGSLLRAMAAHPRVEVAALCDLKAELLATMAGDFNLPDSALYTAFDEFVNAALDIVVIATPIEFHAAQTIAALESGKHVLCEQTVAYTLDECEAVISAQERTGNVYMMVENHCYFHYIREWRKLIARGDLGTLFYAEADYIHEIAHLLRDPDTGRPKWRLTRPPIWYCAHPLGPLLTLMDDRIVKATGASAGNNIFPEEEDLGHLDMEVGLFHTAKGGVIKIQRSQVALRHPQLAFSSLYGTKGFIENGRYVANRASAGRYSTGRYFNIDTMSKQNGAQEIDCPLVDPDAPPEALLGGHGTSEYFLVQDFIAAIDNNTKAPIDAVRAVEFTAPGIVAHEAAMQGGVWLDVPQFR
ncbi:MAG: Gfo/Idh/MocA family oxidoreductase [Chloroflexota bacterium]|nr:Gfo/Idh/MocA family oxidoreductase [Chloroflexota bacterium]MDE2841438.1 Gfo/Idh/MocA family oxidoreductase [Chloroflexota bacterium]